MPTPVLASVSVGNVVDNDAKYIESNATPPSIFADYKIFNRYEQDGHRYMMGITSPGGFQGASVAFCQLAAPTLLWIADFTAARFNTPPIIPSPEQTIGDWVLLDVMPETAHLIVAGDGVTPLYRISGTYVYGHRNPNANVFADMTFPRPPWLKDDFNREIPSSIILQQGIINTQGQGGDLFKDKIISRPGG